MKCFRGGDHFRRHYSPSLKKSSSSFLPSLSISLALTLFSCILYLYLSYLNDTKALAALKLAPETLAKLTEFEKRQKYQQVLISERPDWIELFEEVNPKGVRGVTLHELLFKKGQRVKVSGKTRSDEYYSYIETLQKNKKISHILLETPVYDKKSRTTTFSLTFQYKKWSKK